MTTKTKNNLIITIFFALDILIFWYAVKYPLRSLKSSIEEYIKTKKEIVSIEQKISNFKEFEKKYGVYKENLETMENLVNNNLFIDREIPVTFTQALEEWAGELGIEIEIMPTKIQKTERDFRDFVGYKITLKSKKATPLFQFLKKLENSQWIINVSNVSLFLEQDKKNKETYISEDIFIKVYVR